MAANELVLKIVVSGDSGVGKTNLLLRATRDEFREDTRTTIGLDFFTMSVDMGRVITKATIWDTAGQDRYSAVSRAYYRGAWGVMLVYDITNRESFKNVANWLAEVREHAPSEARVALVGTKSDLVHLRAVTTDEAKTFAEKNGLAFMETSAKVATNVREAFHSLLNDITDHFLKDHPCFGNESTERENRETMRIQPGPVTDEKDKRTCCF